MNRPAGQVAALLAVSLVAASSAAQEADRTRVLRIISRDGTGVAGVTLVGRGGQAPVVTDAEGRATVLRRVGDPCQVLYAGELTVIPADSQASEFVAGGLPALIVSAIDVRDGSPVALASGTLEAARGFHVPLAPDGRTGSLGRSAIAVDPCPNRFPRSWEIDVRPTGPVAGTPTVTRGTYPFVVPARIRRIEVTVPVRPVSRIVLRAVDSAGKPLPRVRVADVVWASRAAPGVRAPMLASAPSPESGVDGRVEVGVLHFDRESVVVRLARGATTATHEAGESAAVPLRPGDVSAGDVVLHSSAAVEWEGPVEGAAWGVGGTPPEPGAAESGTVEIEAVDPDGVPIPRATVGLVHGKGLARWCIADAAGVATFERVPPGVMRVEFLDESLRPASRDVKVVAGTRTNVRLEEPPGRNVKIRVVQSDGAPAPCAEVSCRAGERTRWPSADGVWRSRLTDVEGRLDLRGAPRDRFVVEATLGSRLGRVEVPADQRGDVQVVLLNREW